MTEQIKFGIRAREYDLLHDLDNDQEVVDSAVDDYSGEEPNSIDSVFFEIADGQVPDYINELWEKAPKIKDYIEDTVTERLIDVENFSLNSAFERGFLEYYYTLLKNNKDQIAFNYVVKEVNQFLASLSSSEHAEINVCVHREYIKEVTKDFDTNKTYADLDQIVEFVIQTIKEDLEDY